MNGGGGVSNAICNVLMVSQCASIAVSLHCCRASSCLINWGVDDKENVLSSAMRDVVRLFIGDVSFMGK